MTKDEVEKIRNYPVMKSNEMIQKTSFMLDKQEYNLLQFIISKIKPDDKDLGVIQISAAEYCEVCNIEAAGDNYKNIKSSLKALRDKSVWFETEEEIKLVSWIENPSIKKGTGVITVRLDRIWREHLTQLQEYYTRINMNDIIPMKSMYGKRMYELLMSYQMNNKGSYFVAFELGELKEKLLGKDGAKKKYKEYRDFKAKCLKPALKDMNEYGILNVEIKEKKLGRSVVRLEFTIAIKSIDDRLLAGQQAMNFFEV